MFRYIVLAWRCTDRADDQRALELRTRLDAPGSRWRLTFSKAGVAVYWTLQSGSACAPIPLRNNNGVILGTLFERGEGVNRVRVIELNQSTQIVATAGRQLVESYWGRYIAVLQDDKCDRLWVVRDPTGGLPCIHTTVDRVQIFAACVEDCLDVFASKFAINWNYVRARVLNPYLQTSITGLIGVSQLLPGSCLEVHKEGTRDHVYWDPCRIAVSDTIEESVRAIEMMRDAVTKSVHAWSSCYGAILLKLSGGLDSAIVLGCLRTAIHGPSIVCVNEHSEGADTDERQFARLAAQLAKCVLVERVRDVDVDLEKVFTFRATSTPEPSHAWIQATPTNKMIALRNGATALFTGNGGDQLFLASAAHWPVVDYMYSYGLRWRALVLAHDFAYMEPPARCQSIWSLMGLGIRLGLRASRERELFTDKTDYSGLSIVSSDVVDAFIVDRRSWLPPWLQGIHRLPPGKIAQIYRLSFSQSFYPASTYHCDGLEPVHPLVSQPILEMCLRMPTYTLMSEGHDRAAARKAFSNVLPPEIATRRTKGGVDSHAVNILLRNVRFLREFLLDGELVRHNVLNAASLDETLGGKQEGLAVGTFPLLDLLHVEAWLRSWSRPALGAKPAVELHRGSPTTALPT